MPFVFERLELPEVILIIPKIFKDERGYFIETYKKSDFEKEGINVEFIQDNHSYSIKGVLRGLHYQKKPKAQGKLVRCVLGKIFDVAVDIRKGSPTFGKWVGVELSGENGYMLWIPEGFAHGFLVLSDFAHVIYKVSGSEYSPEHDTGIIWNDEDIGIKWPLEKVEKVILSEKDSKLPRLKDLKEEDLL
ncbi:MAG TPA: dTDP-4-dehydrorhamnose 3,5-epimerase [Thermodesulfobacterium commune]|nr:dTDP-4-dehydrorhamnose 3,5-epimerase [Thermodesulfobacterium commune]